MLGAVATKQGILLATITHYNIVPASYLTCVLSKRTIYDKLKCFISITYKLVSLHGGARAPKAPPLNTPLLSFHLANFTPVYCHPPQCVIVSLDIVFMKIHSCYVYSTVNWPGKLLFKIIRLLNFHV